MHVDSTSSIHFGRRQLEAIAALLRGNKPAIGEELEAIAIQFREEQPAISERLEAIAIQFREEQPALNETELAHFKYAIENMVTHTSSSGEYHLYLSGNRVEDKD